MILIITKRFLNILSDIYHTIILFNLQRKICYFMIMESVIYSLIKANPQNWELI